MSDLENNYAYRGFEISVAPVLLRDSGEWECTLDIWRTGKTAAIDRFDSTTDTFSTREDAALYCLEMGKRIIDGEVAHLTVTNL